MIGNKNIISLNQKGIGIGTKGVSIYVLEGLAWLSLDLAWQMLMFCLSTGRSDLAVPSCSLGRCMNFTLEELAWLSLAKYSLADMEISICQLGELIWPP